MQFHGLGFGSGQPSRGKRDLTFVDDEDLFAGGRQFVIIAASLEHGNSFILFGVCLDMKDLHAFVHSNKLGWLLGE